MVILVVTNSSGKLGQVTPHISPSSLQLQVFQPWTDHDEEANICQKSKSACGTAEQFTECSDKNLPSFCLWNSLLVEQQSNSQNVLTRTCLRSSATSPEFKHWAINGAKSSITASRVLRTSPSAANVTLSSLFISAHTLQSAFRHLPVTLATSAPSSVLMQ